MTAFPQLWSQTSVSSVYRQLSWPLYCHEGIQGHKEHMQVWGDQVQMQTNNLLTDCLSTYYKSNFGLYHHLAFVSLS